MENQVLPKVGIFGAGASLPTEILFPAQAPQDHQKVNSFAVWNFDHGPSCQHRWIWVLPENPSCDVCCQPKGSYHVERGAFKLDV